MNLLGGCIGGLVRWFFRGLRGVTMWILRQIASFIRFASPHATRLLFSALWQALLLMVAAVISLFQGLRVAEQLAVRWKEEALRHGFPLIWELPLYNLFWVLAVVTVAVGWVILLFTAYHGLGILYQLIISA